MDHIQPTLAYVKANFIALFGISKFCFSLCTITTYSKIYPKVSVTPGNLYFVKTKHTNIDLYFAKCHSTQIHIKTNINWKPNKNYYLLVT